MELHIFKETDPILRQPTIDVDSFDMELSGFIDNMIETMRNNHGIGLAAPQVGHSKKIIMCEFEGSDENKKDNIPLTIICNPEIVKLSKDKIKMVEGCLSFPSMEIVVERPKKITIKGFDRYGEKIQIEADGLYARVLQHEFDHLNSTLLVDHLQKINVAFFGSGDFGTDSLKLLEADPQYNIKMVYATRHQTTIRGKKQSKNKIVELAQKLKINHKYINNLSDENIINSFKKLKVDLGVVVDFGIIIPKMIFSIPKYGILNIHPSLLPKYRGPSPIQTALLKNEKYTGVSIIKVDEGIDSGDIISQSETKLTGSETFELLYRFLSEQGASLLLNTIPYYISNELKPHKQDHTKASYTTTYRKEDGFVDQNTPGKVCDRKIKALNPWPGVYTIINGKRVKLLSSHLNKKGNLVIDRVQPESKKEMTYQDYLNGYKKELTFKE